MITKRKLAKVVANKMPCVNGHKIPIDTCETMIDVIFDSIKEALIIDGSVHIKNQIAFKRVDVPEHKKRMPDGTSVTIPFKSKIMVDKTPRFVDDITHTVRQRNMLSTMEECSNKIKSNPYSFTSDELIEIQGYINKLCAVVSAASAV